MKLTSYKDAVARTPQYLYDILLTQYDRHIVDQIIRGYMETKVTSFRVNTLVSSSNDIRSYLWERSLKMEKSSFYDDGFILKNGDEKSLNNLDIYDNGKIYLQNFSSMIPPLILNPQGNSNILDMCAAPGGKTSLMGTISKNMGHIVALEMDKIRYERLCYNISKQHIENIDILNIDARKYETDILFDYILLDAPCSGSGTIDLNDKKSYMSFSEKLVHKSSSMQYALMKKAISLLKCGGILVYSTCSILKEENEDNVNKLLKEYPNMELIPINESKYNNLPLLPTSIKGTLLIRPNDIYEGFYVCKLRKRS